MPNPRPDSTLRSILELLGFVAVVLAVSWLLMLLGLQAASAQTICVEHKVVAPHLEKTYSESPVSMGLTNDGAIIEIFASPTGTFTIVLTRPNGESCVMAAGEHWEDLPKKLAGMKL